MNRRSLLKNSLKASLLPFSGILALPSISHAVQASSTPYRRPKLKITELRTAEVRVHGYQVHVRVYTDQGIVGQGESTDAAQGNVPLIRSFARLLVGQDPIESDFTQWLKDNVDKLPVGEQVEEIIKTRSR